MFSYFLKCTLIDVNGNYFAMQNMACKTFTIAIAANCYSEYFACEITGCVVEAATTLATTTNDWANFISGQGEDGGGADTSLGHFLIIKENDFFVH